MRFLTLSGQEHFPFLTLRAVRANLMHRKNFTNPRQSPTPGHEIQDNAP
jgi:hypothetical protein